MAYKAVFRGLVVVLMLSAGLAFGQGNATEKAASQSPGNDEYVTVPTNSGLIRGMVASDGDVVEFKGIPYAAPPTGDLRWKPPRPPESWGGTRDALEAGDPCPQLDGQYESFNEDCLYLNVTVPQAAKLDQQKLPVMVFIHGGGQTSSAASDYNAEWLVTRGTPAIYVSMHYRLNIFAFYAHEALTAEHPELGSGNYAALDQIQALKWVRDNIANFGGDPDRVTIFGESGGAQAVCILMASPLARGLFHGGISQSGPCQWQYYQPLTVSEQNGVEVAEALGCPSADPMPCLRKLPTRAILEQSEQGGSPIGYQPVWGGGVFPLPMRDAMASGQFNKVPFIQGSTRLEALWTVTPRYDGAGNPLTAEQYPIVLEETFGASRVDAILEQYPLSDYPTPLYALANVLTDSSMNTSNRSGLCVNLLANQIMSPHVPLYSFVFSDGTAPYPVPIFEREFLLGGAAHTKDLSYLFAQTELTPAQRSISDIMIGYWTSFAATGNPNGSGLPEWLQYEPSEPNVISFESDGVFVETDTYSRHKCKFWAEQGFGVLYGPYPTPATEPEYQ